MLGRRDPEVWSLGLFAQLGFGGSEKVLGFGVVGFQGFGSVKFGKAGAVFLKMEIREAKGAAILVFVVTESNGALPHAGRQIPLILVTVAHACVHGIDWGFGHLRGGRQIDLLECFAPAVGEGDMEVEREQAHHGGDDQAANARELAVARDEQREGSQGVKHNNSEREPPNRPPP